MTRQEHLNWCKERALEYVNTGNLTGAFNSMMSDLTKHPDTAKHPALQLGISLFVSGNLNTEREMRNFIEGFN